MVDEKQRRRHNKQATTVGGRGAMTALTTTITKQESANEQRQRCGALMASKRQDAVVEVEEG
jgi:hypothetical protein